MKTTVKTAILAGALAVALAAPVPAPAASGGRMRGPAAETKTQATHQIRQRARLRDGSCLKGAGMRSRTAKKRGNTYGPGDGTGNAGSGPKDGTGYGAPSQRK